MWAGNRIRGLSGRALRLSVAFALVLGCWSAAPASANVDVLAGQGGPAAAPAPVQLPVPAPDAATLSQGAAQTAVQARPVVAAAAEVMAASTVAPAQIAAAPAPAAGSAVPTTAASTPAAGVQRSRRIRASAAQTRAEADRGRPLRTAGHAAPQPASVDAGVLARLLAGAGPRAAAPALESSPSAAPGPAAPAPELPSGADRSTALQGSAAAGIPTSPLLGGFALLLGALALAGPRVLRPFSIGPAACRPAAFVALLERPG